MRRPLRCCVPRRLPLARNPRKQYEQQRQATPNSLGHVHLPKAIHQSCQLRQTRALVPASEAILRADPIGARLGDFSKPALDVVLVVSLVGQVLAEKIRAPPRTAFERDTTLEESHRVPRRAVIGIPVLLSQSDIVQPRPQRERVRDGQPVLNRQIDLIKGYIGSAVSGVGWRCSDCCRRESVPRALHR